MSIAPGHDSKQTQAGLRVHVDVVVLRRDPAMYGRMIVMGRESRDETTTIVTCEVDPPEWRLQGVPRGEREPYDMHLELFDALELMPESEWCGAGAARDAAVAASG